ncbi:hypothetical protein [Prescottella equi]|uniref:hypothetical protein n=1 Tax=Rhodococcus hoagii TaxID=43767 RepID=UPI00111C7C4D|nr:hypothetical protein [Prescottella equi]
MADLTMTRFRCWSAESVAKTVFSDIGALAGNADAIFLAAHTPVELEHRKGPETGSATSGEGQVLDALTSRIGDVERNTLVAVTGGSGSGKSHVVRWVHSHLDRDDERFHVLYVPRAVQTLRELLRRIIEGLPGVEGSDLMNRVDAAIANVRPGELQERLVNEIKIALNWTLEDRAPFDGESEDEAGAREDRNWMLGARDAASGGRVDGLADLIDVPQVKEKLLRPNGRLSQLVQSYFDETSRRDDNDEIFTADDLPLKVPGVRRALSGRRELAELWTIIQRQPEGAFELLEEALRVALPKTVGLRVAGGDTLDSLFRESRRALRTQGHDLVLVFEDLAQFGLVDGELYDQFVTQPGDELAPLRVVFAVTDGAYDRMERTVRTRVEHEFRVGGSALADREQFVGRYLNLVRVGREETQGLWNPDARERDTESWMINACDTSEQGQPCRFRDRCHGAFGSVAIEGLGDVGLYPYNDIALDRAFANLGSDPTPRTVLDECVSTNLMEADRHIANGDYPHERTRTQFDFKVRMAKDALLASNPSSDPERYYRSLVIWGDESPLRPGVLEAFSLDATAQNPRPDDPPKPPVHPPVKTELPNPLLPLFQWQNRASLPEDDVNTYRRALRDLIFDRLVLDQHLVHIYKGKGKEILESLFNTTSFDIEGARGRVADESKSVVFRLTRTTPDIQLLAAARWFREHGHFDPARAKWQWPEGYDPAELMVELETRLDQWATVVRERVLEVTGGSTLAQQVVGIRAVALATAGHDATAIDTAARVLALNAGSSVPASRQWERADEAAAAVISSLRVDDYIGDFAAVRQGESGQPQLVDPRELDAAIGQFLQAPEARLTEAAGSTVDPILAQHAKRLLGALQDCADNTFVSATEAHNAVTTLLEGHTPEHVARRAEEVGKDARDAGFFRPADKYREFGRAVEVLDQASVPGAYELHDGTLGTLVGQQKSIREVGRLAEALVFLKHVMTETKKESERIGTAAGDVSTLETSVKNQLTELSTLVKSLQPGGQK